MLRPAPDGLMGERTFPTAPSYHPGRPVGSRATARRSESPELKPMARCRGHSSLQAHPDAGRRRFGRLAPTGRRAFTHRRAGRADLGGKSRWPAGCTTDLRRNHRPGRWPKWSAARAPVQRPAEEIRMRSITTLLTTLLVKTGL